MAGASMSVQTRLRPTEVEGIAIDEADNDDDDDCGRGEERKKIMEEEA